MIHVRYHLNRHSLEAAFLESFIQFVRSDLERRRLMLSDDDGSCEIELLGRHVVDKLCNILLR